MNLTSKTVTDWRIAGLTLDLNLDTSATLHIWDRGPTVTHNAPTFVASSHERTLELALDSIAPKITSYLSGRGRS